MTDGGAELVLVSDTYLRDHPGAPPVGRIHGWGYRPVGLGLREKHCRAPNYPYVLPHMRAAALDTLHRTQVSRNDIDAF
ncbi:hypothetical protein DIJ64_11525 [Mycobacterium leprae]|uniref:Uncharacterized protein n=1 Tax=Mycobacterium leprae TaxID=1769 RepID=A0AAD0KTJ0_MYCLR|nr:hypothetical protein DIJ64_11525 [Mycobacterium leprae]OAR21371.1 hypothetical protein A8144_06710 [Mycobacterium leprae 3125609]OAX71492.1 hypothetical protein A3216_05160 [Mycobacterium leprae 7935681]